MANRFKFVKIALQALLLAALAVGLFVGLAFLAAFASLAWPDIAVFKEDIYGEGWLLVAVLALDSAGVCWILWRMSSRRGTPRRGLRRAAGGLSALALLIPLGLEAYDRFVVNRYEAVREPGYGWWEDYEPFKPGNRLAKAAPDPAFRFVGPAPRITGAYALYPVYAAAFQALAASPAERRQDGPGLEGSDTIFKKLNEDKADVVFGLRPAPGQIADMRRAGLRYAMTPVLRSAFVFFVHRDNPATNLTQEQLRAVYSGRATSWRELGVPLDAPLRPYQRNEHSGSQTRFLRFMADTPVMRPPTEMVSNEMGGVIDKVADYRNSPGALGFSFRFYVTELIKNPNVKLLAVDGVEPTLANIQNASYPLVTEAYAITARPREGNVARLIDFLRSPEGRRMVEAAGFALPPEGSEDVAVE